MTVSEEDIDGMVGQRVRELRTRLGLTQTQLANAIGVTFQQVQKYERGANRISASKLWLIAQRLGVDAAILVSGLPGLRGDGDPSGGDEEADARARLLVAFERISDPHRRQTVIDVAEGLSLTPSPRRAD